MNLTQLAEIGEFLGGVTVLITLIYLALQVRQASNLSKASMGFAITTEFNRSHEILLANPALMAVLHKVENNETLTDIEERMLGSYGGRLMNTWIAADQAYSQGALSEFLLNAMKDDVVDICERYPQIAENLAGSLARNPRMHNLVVFERFVAERKIE
jgi:hypothetical protein